MRTSVAVRREPPAAEAELELTHRNHFRFGYDGSWYVPRPHEAASWQVAYGRARHVPAEWREACLDTARLIRAATDLDLWVLFSGGIDSEVAVQSFLFAGIPIRVAITRFAHDLNRHDIAYAIKFCETHDVPYRLLDLDIERFFESGDAFAHAERTRCVQPQLLHTMWAMDRIDGYPVLGSGECYLERREAAPGEVGATARGGVWEMLEKERIAAWYRHLLSRGRPGCAGFFQYDPGNMLAFLRDPAIAALCTDRVVGPRDTGAVKAAVYNRHFLLEPRPKYHGFENVAALDDSLRPELERLFGAHNAIARTPYTVLLRELMP